MVKCYVPAPGMVILPASVATPAGTTPTPLKLTLKLPANFPKAASSSKSETRSSALPKSRPIHTQVAATSEAVSSPVSVPPVSESINPPRRSSLLSDFVNVPTEPHININQVKQILLSETEHIHQCFVQETTMELHEFKRMSTGLSSIIDLVDQSEDSQRKLFSPLDWKAINHYFTHMYKRRQYSLE